MELFDRGFFAFASRVPSYYFLDSSRIIFALLVLIIASAGIVSDGAAGCFGASLTLGAHYELVMLEH